MTAAYSWAGLREGCVQWLREGGVAGVLLLCCCCVETAWVLRCSSAGAAWGRRGVAWGRLWAAWGLCGSVLERREGCLRMGCCGVAAAWARQRGACDCEDGSA